uniref:hypothetical protein n=1 Tax=Ornithobacterium rhinotracheale TaxID=28251 RepID=UPI0039A63ABB
MRKLINLLSILALLQFISCKYEKSKDMMKTFNREKDYVVFENKPKTGYYLQINSQNCHYKVLLNDLLVLTYNDQYPAYSVRPGLNTKILKSGQQKLSIIVTPQKGDYLTRNSDITIRLIRYADMSNKDDFGGSTIMMEWEIPAIKDTDKLPVFRFDTIFKADVPYEMNTIDHAVDLSKIDKDVLLEEVVSKYKKYQSYIKNDYDKFNQEVQDKILSSSIPNYKSKKEVMEVLYENKKDFESEKYNSTLQPIENYQMKLYGDGRIASLERLKDGGRIIWCKDPKTGEETLSLPLFIYKDQRDNQWHIW